jgi:hypothetical protein
MISSFDPEYQGSERQSFWLHLPMSLRACQTIAPGVSQTSKSESSALKYVLVDLKSFQLRFEGGWRNP